MRREELVYNHAELLTKLRSCFVTLSGALVEATGAVNDTQLELRHRMIFFQGNLLSAGKLIQLRHYRPSESFVYRREQSETSSNGVFVGFQNPRDGDQLNEDLAPMASKFLPLWQNGKHKSRQHQKAWGPLFSVLCLCVGIIGTLFGVFTLIRGKPVYSFRCGQPEDTLRSVHLGGANARYLGWPWGLSQQAGGVEFWAFDTRFWASSEFRPDQTLLCRL
ncbi:hypothetical protein KI387_008007 [Taxus chinensis]|uniref:Uncharacterized protein n=1 Tax=Taxus chinensis TaxID=29808 RepID=A0AA38CV95_TAXCH|nr:hypothetical protein KI387_008007 [Taxus chinensis]